MKTHFARIVAFVATTLFSYTSPSPASIETSIWENKLEKVNYHDVPFRQAVETIVKSYRSQYPNDARLAGYIIIDADKPSPSVTVNLTRVPFGGACQSLALSAGWHYLLNQQTLTFFPAGSSHFEEVTHIFKLSPTVLTALGMQKRPNINDVMRNLAPMKVKSENFAVKKIFHSEGSDFMLIQGSLQEVSILISLWELFERGLTLQSMR